ncbi:MAG: glycosyltransferase family 1 protein [Candidatus Moraniibacteriota bacterium]
MKIGIDIRCLIGGKRTGVEEYTLELLEHLFAVDRENEYVLFWNAWELPVCPLDWDSRFSNVRLVSLRIPNKLLNFCLWYFRFPHLDRLIGGVDVFFMPNLNFAAFSRGVKVVLTAHDVSFERYPETFSWKRRLWHMFVNFRRLALRAEKVIAVSQSTRDDLVEAIGIVPKSVTVIRSGISERFCRMNRNDSMLSDVKRRYELPYRFILFVGTIEPRKNILSLVRAFDSLVGSKEAFDYDVVIAGTHGWKCEGMLEEIDRLPSRARIHFTGFVRDEDKPALYNLSSLFVYPSLYEGFGFPPLEAAACGVPVITSNTSSFPETIGEGAMMIDPLRPDDISRALREVLRDKTLRDMLSQQGEMCALKFQWKDAARKTLGVFRDVARRS